MARRYGRAPVSADEVVEPVNATSQQAELLGCRAGDRAAADHPHRLRPRRGAGGVLPGPFRPDRTRIALRTRVDIDALTETGSEPGPSGAGRDAAAER